MKIHIPDNILQEIFELTKSTTHTLFFAALLNEELEKPEIETIFSLPSLSINNIEDILGEQESFDAILVFAPKKNKDLKPLKEFILDIGLQWLDLPNHTDSNNVNKPKSHSIAKEIPPTQIEQDNTEITPNTIENFILPEAEFVLDTSHLREIFTTPRNGFQKRNQQVKMIRAVLDSFETSTSAFIEAATGTGKSLGYLLPSILLAEQRQEKVVISTHTKALQNQLLDNDIPKACELLDSQIQVGIVKGKSNYLCLRRFFDFKSQITQNPDLFMHLQEEATEAFHITEQWLTTTKSGDLDSIGTDIQSIRGDINTQTELCAKSQCPYFKDCFYYKTWNQLEKSNIIIVNHSLLTAQMELDYKNIPHEIIPQFQYLIIDEAHHFPKNTLKESSFSLSYFTVLLGKLFSSSPNHKKGLLPYLFQEVEKNDIKQEYTIFLNKITSTENAIESVKEKLLHFVQSLNPYYPNSEYYRITTEIQSDIITIQPQWQELKSVITYVILLISDVLTDISGFADEFKENYMLTIQQIQSYKDSITLGIELWSKLFEEILENTVLWLEEKGAQQYTLSFLNLNNKNFLQTTLWNYKSTIFTSATLSLEKSFGHIQKKLYLNKPVAEYYLPPVFSYKNNCLFLGITDIPNPTEKNFQQNSTTIITDLINSVEGGSLILCTSWTQMNYIVEFLESSSNKTILSQGSESMASLLEKAKTQKNTVLIGVDSFWEGIDIPGSALELVIITKIPFRPPGHPITDTLSEIEKELGNNPFYTISLIEASMKFKQGFGRLLRNESDKGVIVSLDTRIIKKNYGKTILSSLHAPIQTCNTKTATKQIQDFLGYK